MGRGNLTVSYYAKKFCCLLLRCTSQKDSSCMDFPVCYQRRNGALILRCVRAAFSSFLSFVVYNETEG